MDKTMMIKTEEIKNEKTKKELKSICDDLEERGYNPLKQIAGYIISGDPGYISSYKDCRGRIKELDRTSLVEIMLQYYLK